MNNTEIAGEARNIFDGPESREENSSNSIRMEGEKIPRRVLVISYPFSKIINILLWIGESIIVFIKNEWFQLRAAEIKYFAGILTMIAAKSEGQEIESYTGVLPEENPAKVIGTILSETGSAILISVLASEVATTKRPSNAPVISPFVGGVGAVQ